MPRVLTILLLVVLFTLQPVYAFPFIDDSTQKVLRQTWDAQTLSDLANGVIAVPETTINDYLTQILPDYPPFAKRIYPSSPAIKSFLI